VTADSHGAVTPRLLVGIFITLLGALLLLDNMDLLDAGQILHFWPLALVALGLVVFVQAIDTGGRINGGALIIFGSFLLLNRLGFIHLSFWNLFWPLVLILAGTNLIMQNYRTDGVAGASPAETVSLFAMWGGSQRTSTAPRFRGGDMTAIMGGCELDLRQATIPPGETAIIDVLAVMGGHNLRVPEDWAVVTRVIPFMGGVVDKRLTPKAGATTTLVLRGFIMMGGLEIKN